MQSFICLRHKIIEHVLNVRNTGVVKGMNVYLFIQDACTQMVQVLWALIQFNVFLFVIVV